MTTTDEAVAGYQMTREALQNAAAAYYGGGDVVMSDEQYDRLMADAARFEAQHPEITDPISTQVAAGAGLNQAESTLAHSRPMLSLDNVYSVEEFQAWVDGLAKRIGKPVSDIRLAVEPKLDGLATAIRYVNGRPVAMLKRGDGITGEDATPALADITNLPGVAGDSPVQFRDASGAAFFQFEVRGEVVFTHEDFQAANAARELRGDRPFTNPRNGAAGAVAGAATRDYRLPLRFYAYDVVGLPDASHVDLMVDLADAGFATAASVTGSHSQCDLRDAISEIEAGSPPPGGGSVFTMACDGMVIKADLPSDRAAAGAGPRAPRWAIAYKYPSQEVTSTLLEVTWAVGRTGVIAPRARIEPVECGGTRVEYATLHNPEDIARKGFLIGDPVLVRRAGEVIPRLKAPLVALRDGTQTPVQIPTQCPQCGGAVDDSGARLLCRSGECGLIPALTYAVSRDALDIEGLSVATITRLVESEAFIDLASIFEVGLRPSILIADGGVAPANAPKIVAQIEKAKDAGFARVLTALGLAGTGRSMSRRMAAHFGSMDALLDASPGDLSAVDGLGQTKADSIYRQLAKPGMRNVIQRLAAAGVRMGEAVPETATGASCSGALGSGALDGLAVCVTGSMVGALAGLSRNEVNELIERHGGRAASSVSKSTGLLVAGQKAGSKLVKAESLGVQVVSEDDFAAMLAAI